MSNWIDSNHARMFGSKLPIFQQDVESKPSPVPVKGWDAISPISGMPADYAVILDNCIPRPGWVEVRGGYTAWADTTNSAVNSLMTYRPSGDPEKLFAAAGSSIYDVSDYSESSVADTGYTSSRFQYINFQPAGGDNYLIVVNGSDTARIYNGTAWANFAVTGVTSSDIINISVHKRRIWLIEKNSMSAWYLATDAIAGAATEFEFGSLFNKGGYLVASGSWTLDGGNGPDDYVCFITNRGQIAIYKGTDPGNTDAWFLIGVFDGPPPIGHRCFKEFGSDLLIITIEGLLPISKSLPFDPSGVRSISLTNRILNAMLNAAQQSRETFGWSVETFPAQSILLMNVPQIENTTQVQFVMNTLTGAWCRFTGWNANVFAIYNENLLFGGNDGNVNLAYFGAADGEMPIAIDMQCAFNYYDDPGRIKTMNMCRPYIISDVGIIPTLFVDSNFATTDFSAPISTIVQSGSLWDVALWDVTILTQGLTSINNWQTVSGEGTALAIHMKANILPENIIPPFGSVGKFDIGVFDHAVFDGIGIVAKSGFDVPVLRFNQFQCTLEFGTAVG